MKNAFLSLIIICFIVLPKLCLAKGPTPLCNKCVKEADRCLSKTLYDETKEEQEPSGQIVVFCEKKKANCGKKYNCDAEQLEEVDKTQPKFDEDIVIKMKKK